MGYVRDIVAWVAQTSTPRNAGGGTGDPQPPCQRARLSRTLPALAANDDVAAPTADARVIRICPDARRMDGSTVLLGRMAGATVVDREGRAAGEISDLSVEGRTALVQYVIVSLGKFLGLRSKFHPIPWELLRYDAKGDQYILPITMSEMDEAPSLTLEELERLLRGDRVWRDRIASFYIPRLTMEALRRGHVLRSWAIGGSRALPGGGYGACNDDDPRI